MYPLSKPSERSANSLRTLVSKLSSGFIPITTERRSLIINNVPTDIIVSVTSDQLESVISSLINKLVRHTEYCCIRIDAESTEIGTMVILKTNRDINQQYNSGFLNQVIGLAKVIDGVIDMPSGNWRMVTLSFPNILQAA